MLASDNELLGRYLYKQDALAFEELVKRHSGLVMGVCRSMLFHAHDAEDAFQGTFLILSRKANSLVRHGSIAGWLYQVAIRNCLQIRRRRGRAREIEMVEEPIGKEEPWRKISQAQENDLIYQEINRLPKKYRDAIVLCHLQGHTRGEAAELLDRTEAAVKAALARGRNLLRRRLIRSGLMTSAILAMLQTTTVSAQEAVTDSLIHATLQHCQGITPAVSAGTTPQFVQSLAHQGVMSMHTANLIKSFTLTAGIAIAISLPIAVVAQALHKSDESESIVVELASDTETSDDAAVLIESTTNPSNETETEPDQTFVDFAQPPQDFSITNSEAYWEAMLKSYRMRAKSLELKANDFVLNEAEKASLTADMHAAEANVIEAQLNLNRIRFEKRNPEVDLTVNPLTKHKSKLPSDFAKQSSPEASAGIRTTERVDYFLDKRQANPLGKSGIPPSSTTPVKPGESLLVESFADESLNRRVVVQADNTISLPLAGTISVTGLTTDQIRQLLEKRFVEYVKDPMIFVARESASMPLNSSAGR